MQSLMEMLQRRKTVTKPEARFFMNELELWVKYLNPGKLLQHRDLKPDNLFFDHNLNLKIGVFGVAIKIHTSEGLPR